LRPELRGADVRFEAPTPGGEPATTFEVVGPEGSRGRHRLRMLYRASWAKLLARVYDVDAHVCPACRQALLEVARHVADGSISG